MKYIGMPSALWALFGGSFRRQLTPFLGVAERDARDITARAHARYKAIIAQLPDFERGDRFAANIASCAMLAAFILCLPERPGLEALTDYYAAAMMTPAMKLFCRKSAKGKFSEKDLRGLRATEKLRAGDRNPYSWNMTLHEYPDGSGYEARFSSCGICALMKKLGLYDLTPALCRLDYTMSEAGGRTRFVREYTLASGGPYCDCGYKRL